MAKPLVVQFGGRDLPLQIERIDRAKLYGYVEVEVVDEQNRKCELATLASDGHTVIARGGTAFAQLSPAGLWRDKSTLQPVGPDGNELKPVPSTFSNPVPLGTPTTIDDYLSHNIKSIYKLAPEGDATELLAALKAGQIFKISFSYRGGLEPDAGFLLANAEGQPFLALGKPTTLEFVGLQQIAAIEETEAEPEAAEEEDGLDFGMM